MDPSTSRSTVISVRVDPQSLQAIDLLVRAGLAQSRSEAAAQFVAMGIRAADDLLAQAGQVAEHLQRLKGDLLSAIKARDVAGARAVVDRNPAVLRSWSRDGEWPAGESPVLAAVHSGANEVAQMLLERGAELSVFEAAAIGESQRVRQFLDAEPALAQARSQDGWTLLHMASYFGHLDVARLLLDRGADVMARSDNDLGSTPLHSALAGRRYDAARLLLERGAGVNARNARSWAPLHLAVCTGQLEVVERLAQAGADLDAATADGLTPARLARERGYPDIADWIEARLALRAPAAHRS
jgi:hypothetical protein